MKWSHVFLFFVALDVSVARYILSPFPDGSENPVVALMALDAPVLLGLAHGWYAAMPGVMVVIGVTALFRRMAGLVRGGSTEETGQGRASAVAGCRHG